MNNEKSLGIERFIDGLGRLVIPKEMRDRLNFATGQLVSVKLYENHIRIEKATTSCSLCGANENIKEYKDHSLCQDCLDGIVEIYSK